MTTVRALCFWLLGLTLASAGVLERGYVLCRSGDGEARVEAAGGNGTCGLQAGKTFGGTTSSVAQELGHRCGGCEDVTLSSGTVRAPVSPESLLFSDVPQVVTWMLSDLLAADQRRLSMPRLVAAHTTLTSDTARIRQTVILVI